MSKPTPEAPTATFSYVLKADSGYQCTSDGNRVTTAQYQAIVQMLEGAATPPASGIPQDVEDAARYGIEAAFHDSNPKLAESWLAALDSASPQPQPEPTSKGDGGAHYVERCGRCAISGPRDDVLHLSAIIHSSQQRETQEAAEVSADIKPLLVAALDRYLRQDETANDTDNGVYREGVRAMQAAVSAPQEAGKAEPDMRAICEALGFDPTNHHNAAKCPYCRPPESKEAGKAEGECPGCGGLGRIRVLRCEQCDGTGKILASPPKEAGKVEAVAECRNCGDLGYRREANGEKIPCDLCDDKLETIRARIESAIKEHLNGGDLWLVTHLAAKAIVNSSPQALGKVEAVADEPLRWNISSGGYRFFRADGSEVHPSETPLYLRPSQQALAAAAEAIKETT